MKKRNIGYWVSGSICFTFMFLGMCLAFGAETNTREALAFLMFSVASGAGALMLRLMPVEDKSQNRPSSLTTILLSVVMLCVAASKMWSVNMVYDVLKWIGVAVVVAGVIGLLIYEERKAKK